MMMTTHRSLQDEPRAPTVIGEGDSCATRSVALARFLLAVGASLIGVLALVAPVIAQGVTPTPSATLTATATPTGSATPTRSITPTTSATPTPRATPRATPTATHTPTPTGKARPTRSITPTPNAAETAAAIKRVEFATATPTVTPTPAATATLNRPARGEKVIYLTFDDGPSEFTQQILDLLAEYDARATFFVLGVQAAAEPAMIEKMYEAGHGIANHTWKHVDLTTVGWNYFEAEIADTAEAIGKYESACLRPPYGARSQTTYDYAEEMGYTLALWSIDTNDWRLPGANAIANRVLDQLHNRAVVLMHDGGGNRTQTVAALRILLPRLQALGYQMRAVCRDDVMPQVGDHIVGIPSELEMEMAFADGGAGEAYTTEIALAAPSDAATLEEAEYAAPTATVSVQANGITFPAEGEVVRGRVLVQGIVSTAGAHWQLETVKDGEEAVLIDAGEGPTAGVGGLTIWDTRTLENGPRRLRLEITHGDGAIEQQIVVVTIRN